MTQTGDPLDNATAERVNGILKDELLEEVHDDSETALINVAVAHITLEPFKKCWKNRRKKRSLVALVQLGIKEMVLKYRKLFDFPTYQ